MISTLKIGLLLLLSYALIVIMIYNLDAIPNSIDELYLQDQTNALGKDLSFLNKKAKINTKPVKRKFTMSANPFKLLDAYPKIPQNMFKPKYDEVHFAIKNEKDYCQRVDMYNLRHPENMFENKNFFTDFLPWMIVRGKAMSQIGNVLMEQVTLPLSWQEFTTPTYPLDIKINNFYVYTDGFYRYHKIGKNYLCPTQMFNHIPGHKNIIRKDEVLKAVERYAKFYTDQPQCFNNNMVFPKAFRLYVKTECVEFFNLINSKEYLESLKDEPVQYLLKVGHGAHKSQGVFVLDRKKMYETNHDYAFGKRCGHKKESIIAQKYITNPLLLDKNNKFDLRLYMFIASANPLIAYYHDGYLRVSLNSFEKNSKDRATHLTNTYLVEQKLIEAITENKTINGMTAEDIKNYHLWEFAELEEYLLEIGKVNDPNWLENYLRPAVKKALMHVVRATTYSFWKQSNVHELYGMDFMLDENLNLWFIECNPNPLLTGVRPALIERMLLDMFEIQYAYYHSRMNRVLDVIYKMQAELEEDEDADINKWKKEYKQAVKNKIEPEYQLSENNTWSVFIDQGLLPSSNAYFGYLDEECLNSKIDQI